MLARNRWYCRHSSPGAVPWPRRKYPAAKIEMPAEAAPSRQEKEARQRIAPQVHRQVGQSDGKRELLRRCREAHDRHDSERRAAERAQRKKRPPDKTHAQGAQKTGEADKTPESDAAPDRRRPMSG